MRRSGRKWLSLLLALCMVVTMLPAMSVPAAAADFNSNQTIGEQTISTDTTWNIPAGVTVSVQGQITVNSGATLTLTGGGTIQRAAEYTTGPLFAVGGTLTATGVVMDGQNIAADYAAIKSMNADSIIKLNNVTIQNFESSASYGGALRMDKSGQATLTNCTIQNNRAASHGGAIYAGDDVVLYITGGTLNNNRTTSTTSNTNYGGGALYIREAVVFLNNVTFSQNTSTRGGAIYNSSYGTLTITGGSIAGNTATKSGYEYSAGIFHSSQNLGGSVLNLNENVQILDPIYLDSKNASKVAILQSSLQYPLTLYCADAGEGRVVIEGDTNYTVTAQDMARLSIKNDGWYFGLSGENNQIFLTALKSEAYIPIIIRSNDDSLNVTLKQNGQTVALDYSETAGGYIGSVPAGTYDVYVDGTNTGNNITVSVNDTVFGPEVLMHHSHPICGDSSCQEHGGAVSFYALTSLNGTLAQGNYYLNDTVDATGDITISGAVNLCLNGKTLNLNGHHIKIEGSGNSLTLCDCGTTGKITGGSGTHGGAIYVSGGTLTLYSGTITGNTANGNGGGVYVLNGSFTMSGGSITDNTANQGGGVYVYTNGSFSISGAPTVTNNTRSSDNTGNNVLLLKNKTIGITNPLTSGKIGVTMETLGVFTSGWGNHMSNADPNEYFTSDSGTYLVMLNNDSSEVMLHKHSYTYTADGGGTITENCTCGHEATATISVPDGANLTYTGSAITPAEVTYSDDWQGGDLTITYSNNTNVGTATATITKDNATASVTFTIEKANQTPPTASEYSIDYFNEKITSIASGCKVYTAQDASTEVQSGETVTPGTTYYIRREGDANHHPSDFTSFTVAVRPDAPSVTAAAETIKGKGDGKVTGVTTAMEYSTDGGQNWTPCTGAEITGLAANTIVMVRVKATASAPHGVAASCNIEASENTLTVTFEENGGSAVTDITGLAYNSTITAPANPTKTGYTFAGWYKEATCTNLWDFSTDTVTEDITLYAKWTANTDTPYTVKHWQQKLNGGSEQNDANYTLTDTESLTGTTGASVTPAVKHYDGFTAPSATTVTIAADGNTVVNYYYTRNSYTVTLEKGTGIASVSGADTYQYGETVTISAEVSDGYVWDKWSDSNTEQNRTFPMGAGNMTLTAQATPISYTIIYHLDGGTDSGNPTTYTVESEAITLNNPTRTGYTFAGWTGTGLSEATTSVTIPKGSTGDRTYTAAWTANTYAINYAGMDGAQHGENHPTTHTYDTDTLVPNPVKAGYTFAGWLVNGAGDEVKDLTLRGTGYTANITLTAQWTLDTPAVELTADKNSVTYGKTITLTAAAAHTAYGLTYTYQWYKGDAALSGKTESTLTLTDVADSGSYHVAVTASDGSLSSTVSSTPAAVEIKPLGIAVTWSGLTRVYGENASVKATLNGVLESDICTLSAITYQQGDTTVAAPANAGEYTVKTTLSGDDADNYTLKNGTATLTIRPKAVGFTVSGNAVKGDGAAKTATITPTDNTLTQTGYTVTYRQGTATVAAPTAVGSYEIWVEITNGNYRHTNGKTDMQVGTLTITQTPPVLYDVTFAGGEGTVGIAPDGLSAVADAKIILPENTFTRTSHQFIGWSYGGRTYQPGDSFAMPARDVTFIAQWQPTYGITVTVREPKPDDSGKMQPVSGAVVSLWLGANKLDEQSTGNDGKYTFAKLLPGIYNLVVTKDERTVTTMVEITTEDVAKTADLPRGATNSIVKVTEGSPDVVVGNLETVFAKTDETVYTDTDQGTVEAGGKVEFTFTADEKQKGDSTISDDMDKIAEKKDDAVTVGLVMDYKLEKEVFDAAGQKINDASKPITESNVLLELRLPLPAELQGKASYAVYRVHDSAAEEMKANPGSGEEGFTVEGSYLTIYAQKFSTYAIGYTESSGNSSNNGGGSSTPVYPPSIVQPEHGTVTVSPKNPQKGDKVTITPAPEEGYTVDTVTVTDSNGKPVGVTSGGDGSYTFVQPSGKVTITVTFRRLTSVSGCPRDESCPMAPFTDANRNAWYHDGVHYCVEEGLMTGTGKTTFAPNAATTRGMIVTILWRLEGSPIVDASLDYDDVKAEAWYGEAVRWADSVGVVTGYGNGKFGPNDTITREQMAAMLWRYAGSPKADGSLTSFTDGAQTSSWAQSAMIWAVEQGLITGVGNNRLEPKGQATRAQAATILMRFAQDMAK